MQWINLFFSFAGSFLGGLLVYILFIYNNKQNEFENALKITLDGFTQKRDENLQVVKKEYERLKIEAKNAYTQLDTDRKRYFDRNQAYQKQIKYYVYRSAYGQASKGTLPDKVEKLIDKELSFLTELETNPEAAHHAANERLHGQEQDYKTFIGRIRTGNILPGGIAICDGCGSKVICQICGSSKVKKKRKWAA